ncbi:hypothetical protein AMEX_G13256, partial [Astyanax mexicanus]
RVCETYFILRFFTDPGQASVLHQKPAVLSVKAGEAVTLRCSFEEQKMNEKMVWYKQKPGQAPQNVGSLIANIKIISPEFEKSGIKLERTSNSISLIIPNTAKHDEGTYFCGISLINTVQFSTGTFLTVTDDSQPNILVLQTPVSSSVPSGEAVNLQCTVLSEIRSAELRVFWFRSAAGSSFPEIIFTHHNNSSSSNNSSRQCEINSVYNFSKIIGNDNNTGIFYCAVQTCGRIIIGNGTTVNLVWPLDPVVMCLGAAVGVCVVVISVQAAINRKKKICEHCIGTFIQIFKITYEQDAEELNYAALNFSERKTKRTRKLKKEKSEDMLYSTVRCSSVNDRRTDH